ncbi:MAG: SGNH/GDSL hydrolase family protein, partial [Ilumatobacteraceae bacterium]
PANRIDAQYRRVGVTDPRMEISGARSIVETVGDQLNAKEAAEAIKATGYEGCWVLAMGTTDTANVAVGSPTGLAERIDRMLSVIGDDPIMWVTVKTLDVDGAWSNTNMQTWNQTLTEAQARYPNIEVYDWAAVVQDDWFQDDNIHYTSVGYTERARLIADALVTAYPAS